MFKVPFAFEVLNDFIILLAQNIFIKRDCLP